MMWPPAISAFADMALCEKPAHSEDARRVGQKNNR
jgi:hypothetical protein